MGFSRLEGLFGTDGRTGGTLRFPCTREGRECPSPKPSLFVSGKKQYLLLKRRTSPSDKDLTCPLCQFRQFILFQILPSMRNFHQVEITKDGPGTTKGSVREGVRDICDLFSTRSAHMRDHLTLIHEFISKQLSNSTVRTTLYNGTTRDKT